MNHCIYIRRVPGEPAGLLERESRKELVAAIRAYARMYPHAAMTWFQDHDDPLNTPETIAWLEKLENSDFGENTGEDHDPQPHHR